MANAAVAQGASVSLHSSNPGATGANEISGGSPAYARQTTTWGSASMVSTNSVVTGSNVTFNVPASDTVAYFGVWTSGGTFLFGAALTPSITIGSGAQGQVVVTPTYTEQPATT